MSLKKIRKQKGLTQKELGALAGISDIKICYIETGKIKPENIMLKTAITLARALECSPEEFLDEVDSNAGL